MMPSIVEMKRSRSHAAVQKFDRRTQNAKPEMPREMQESDKQPLLSFQARLTLHPGFVAFVNIFPDSLSQHSWLFG